MTIPFLKPSDLKPAPADGKLVRDTTELFQKAPAVAQMAMLAKLSADVSRNPADDTAISAIFTDAVRAEEAEPTDEAKVRTDALKTLHDLMTDEYVPHAIRADIAKYVIESRIG